MSDLSHITVTVNLPQLMKISGFGRLEREAVLDSRNAGDIHAILRAAADSCLEKSVHVFDDCGQEDEFGEIMTPDQCIQESKDLIKVADKIIELAKVLGTEARAPEYD